MNNAPTVFAQIMAGLDPTEVARAAARFPMPRASKTLQPYDHLAAMVFAQLTYRESLRDVEACLYHMGFREPVARSTLADGNESRDWRIWESFAGRLIVQARELYISEDIIMKRFVNRVDHVAWICHYDNVVNYAAELSKVLDTPLERLDRPELGIVLYHNLEAGLEVFSPCPEVTNLNRSFHERLKTRGEGLFGIVFGVKDLDGHKARLEGLGYKVGSLIDQSHASWRDKLTLRQRMGPDVINSMIVFGENDYSDDMIRVEDCP